MLNKTNMLSGLLALSMNTEIMSFLLENNEIKHMLNKNLTRSVKLILKVKLPKENYKCTTLCYVYCVTLSKLYKVLGHPKSVK